MPRKYSLYSPTARLRRSLYKRSRSNRAFAGLAGVLFVIRAVRRLGSRQPEVAAVEQLAPGQVVLIRTIPPPTRRQRRAARRQADG